MNRGASLRPMILDPIDMGRGDALTTGLSSADAAARLSRDGPNALPETRSPGWYRLLLEVLREPMIGLLLAGALLYALMGEPADGALLLVCVGFVVTLTVVQERRTERALEALGGLASPRALVLRDGVERRIAARELVVGDLVLLNEGDRVPADALLRQSALLTVDESLLTGESVPVRKRASLEASMLQRPGGDDHAGLYSGTLVTAGHGLCEVIAVGAATELALISRSLGAVTPEITPLQRETRRVVRVLAVAGLLACVLVGITYALTRGGDVSAWREGGLAGIAMAMSMIPEEFPVVLTVFLALGAWRIGRHHGHQRHGRGMHHRYLIAVNVEGRRVHQRRHHGGCADGRHQHGIAIGPRARQRSNSKCPGSAWAVFHRNGLAKLILQKGLQEARNDIRPAPWCETHQHCDGA